MDEHWSRQKDHWLTFRVSSDKLLRLITLYVLEHPEDLETVLWLSTRGTMGSDNGGSDTFNLAQQLGGFVARPT